MSSYALLFPGQGSQYVGMTSKLQDLPGTHTIFRTAERVLGYDLQSLCLQGPREMLDQTVHCQPAVVVGSLVALQQLEAQSPEVSMTNYIHMKTTGLSADSVWLYSNCWLQCGRDYSSYICRSPLLGTR